MAIGDLDAPGDFGRRIGGNSRIIRRKRPRPRPIGGRADIAGTLPAEYAEFRLEDGRTFGEVMGASFFGPPSGADGGEPISDSERQRLREGNYPLARMIRENPDRFAPPRGDLTTRSTGLPPGHEGAGLPAPGGDNEADFTNLPFGPEEGDEADSTTDFPIAKPPQGIGATLSGQPVEASDVDPRANADVSGAGLPGFAGDRIDIEEILARKPTTYNEYLGNAKAMARAAGISDFEVQRFATGLSGLRGIEGQIPNSRNRGRREPSKQQVTGLVSARKEAAASYGVFVRKVLAQRNTPLDLPRAADGSIDMGLVQRGFVYRTRDGALFMLDAARENFVEARKLRAPNARGDLYAPAPAAPPIALLDGNGRPRHATVILAEAQRSIIQTGKGHRERSGINILARRLRDAAHEARRRYGAYTRALKFGPGHPKTKAAWNNYRASLRTLREKGNEIRRAIMPEAVNRRDMMFRADGRGPQVTHKIPMAGHGSVDVDNLDKRVTYEVEDGMTFRWDGERFREIYWDGEVWVARSDPARTFGNRGISQLSEEMEYDRDAVAIGRETGFRFTEEAAKIHTLAVEMTGVRRRLAALQREGQPSEQWRIDVLEGRLEEGMSRLRNMRAELVEKAKPEVLSIEKMPGRAADPGRVEHATNAVVQELGDRVAGAAEFAATQRAIGSNNLKEMFDKIKAGTPVDEIAPLTGYNTLLRDVLLQFERDVDFREDYERAYVGPLDARDSGLFKWGQGLRNRIRKAYPSNPRYKGGFLTDILPRLVDDVALSIGLWAALRKAEVVFALAEATAGAVDESSTKFREALAQNRSIDEAYRMSEFGIITGMTDGLPVVELLEKVNKATGGKLSGVLWELAVEGSEAALIATIQGALDEAAEKRLASEEEVDAARNSPGVKQLVISLVGSKR